MYMFESEFMARAEDHKRWMDSHGRFGTKMHLFNKEIKPNVIGHRCDLSNMDLRGVCLIDVDLSNANLTATDFSGSELECCSFRECVLTKTVFDNCHLKAATFAGSRMQGTSFIKAYLEYAVFNETNMTLVDLTDAVFGGTTFYRAIVDPSDFPTAVEWLDANLEKDVDGWIVYKRCGAGHTEYYPPASWKFEPGSFLVDTTVNMDRTEACSWGVNVGTREWCDDAYPYTNL